MKTHWNIHKPVEEEIKKKFPELSALTLQLLVNREIESKEAIEEFLNPEFEKGIHDPFLFRDMAKAVKRIFRAIHEGEHITVHGDYDADGVCGSAVVSDTLKAFGADHSVYLPHRDTEGYGLNVNTVEALKKRGTKLIITVDCGISNLEAVNKAQDTGMDVIITDHHHVPNEVPKAHAILNPQDSKDTYPFPNLAGSGVAYKLATALITTRQGKTDISNDCAEYFDSVPQVPEGFEKWLLDVVAISTVTDVMPILGENRTLEKYGLIVLSKTRRKGLRELVKVFGGDLKSIDTSLIGFQIGPRLNAAGRLDHSSTAYQLLVTEDATEARMLARNLQKTNTERQKVADTVTKEALAQIKKEGSDAPVLVAHGTKWPVGVVGLVAGRITQKFYRPTFVLTENRGKMIGSGRSVPEFNEIEALDTMSELFEVYGGHSQACGVTLKNVSVVETFRDRIRAEAEKSLKGVELKPTTVIDMELGFGDASWDSMKELQRLEPFGYKNPKPVFVTYGATVNAVRHVGKEQKHLKLTLAHGETSLPVIAFGFGDFGKELSAGDLVDCVYNLDINEWNGNREIQLNIIDMKKAS